MSTKDIKDKLADNYTEREEFITQREKEKWWVVGATGAIPTIRTKLPMPFGEWEI